VDKPNAEPYKIIYAAIHRAHERDLKIGVDAGNHVRPWLQAFSLKGMTPKYGAPELEEQKRAVYDAGYDGWVLWSPGSVYEPVPFRAREEGSVAEEAVRYDDEAEMTRHAVHETVDLFRGGVAGASRAHKSGAADPVCQEILADFVRDLGATIVTAIHAYNPTVVILAGGPMAASDLFLDDVQAYVDRHAFIFPRGRVVEVRRARLEEHAGVLGAAALVLDTFEEAARR